MTSAAVSALRYPSRIDLILCSMTELSPDTSVSVGADLPGAVVRIGCVSYLNAKPLVHGLDEHKGLWLYYDVPSALLGELEAGRVDMALCPVIDYHRSTSPLQIVPVGGIGCLGQTLTVRLLSKTPIHTISCVHIDSHSHTSVVLMQIILAKRYGLRPRLIDLRVDREWNGLTDHASPASLLLIGDKVVASDSVQAQYQHQLDLGEAWFELTGLPFVFAVWMARRDAFLGDAPELLAQQRTANAGRLDAIVACYAQTHGWPPDLARCYLKDLMRYDIGPKQLEAIERFIRFAVELGILTRHRPIHIHAHRVRSLLSSRIPRNPRDAQ